MKMSKMFRRGFLLPAVGAVALIGAGSAAFAKPAGSQADGPRRGGLCAKLSCTDTQREELREIMVELRADTKGDREAIKRLRGKLAEQFAKEAPDEAAMRAIQAELATHEKELRERGFDAMMEVHGLLDASQRAQLAEVMKHRGPRALMGRGKRGHKRGKDGKRAKRGE